MDAGVGSQEPFTLWRPKHQIPGLAPDSSHQHAVIFPFVAFVTWPLGFKPSTLRHPPNPTHARGLTLGKDPTFTKLFFFYTAQGSCRTL